MATSTYFTDDGKRLVVNIEPVSGFEEPWAVVLNPGDDDEEVWSEHVTFGEALRVRKTFGKDQRVDVMKRRPDGSLTTEF